MSINIQKHIENKINAAFSPDYLRVENESHLHHVPPNSSTHFKIVIVSHQFDALSRVARHKTVYALLNDELNNGVHALALHLYSPKEWQNKHAVPDSPKCQGQNK